MAWLAMRLAALALLTAVTAVAASGGSKGLTFRQAFGSLDEGERAGLDAGRQVVRVQPWQDNEIAVFAAMPVAAGPERLVAWVRAIEEFQRSRHVKAIGRFSDPPRLSDLAALTLPDEDLEALRACNPGDCRVKLSEAEIVQLRQVANSSGAQWKSDLQEAFRRVVLTRVQAYVAGGLRSAPPYRDHESPVSLADEFAQVAGRADLREPHSSTVFGYLRRYPDGGDAAESMLYWAREQYSGAKPVVTVTHAAIFKGAAGEHGEALVVSKQVFASHYFTASLSLSQAAKDASGRTYLLYLRRARLDIPDGFLGGLVRHMIQRRLRSDVPGALNEMRKRLESGPPRP